jgi:hypothetical protein
MESDEINRPRAWNGNQLAGNWLMSLKIDGIRAIWHDEQGWLSRANKPLYNIPPWQQDHPRDCEIFVGSFRDTIRATRTKFTKGNTPAILPKHMYGLDPLCQIASNRAPLSLARMTLRRCANVPPLTEPRPAARSPT